MSENQRKDPYFEGPPIQIDGPTYADEHWTVSITIGARHKTLIGATPQEVQEQAEHEIDEQIAELEKSRARLRKLLGQ